MSTRRHLPLAAAAAAAGVLTVPGAAHADPAPAPAPERAYRLTDCRVDTVPSATPPRATSSAASPPWECPDGTTNDGNPVTLPGTGTTTSFTGCSKEYPVSQSLVVVSQG